jgi:hypothetical protein
MAFPELWRVWHSPGLPGHGIFILKAIKTATNAGRFSVDEKNFGQ